MIRYFLNSSISLIFLFSYSVLQSCRTFSSSHVKFCLKPPPCCSIDQEYSLHLWLTPFHPSSLSLEITFSKKPSLPVPALVWIRYSSTVFPILAVCTHCTQVNSLFTYLNCKLCEGRKCVCLGHSCIFKSSIVLGT